MGWMNKYGIPKEVILKLPVVTAVGNCEVHVENYRSIMEISEESIKIMTKKGPLTILGKRLVVQYYGEDDLSIEGFIKCIEL